MTREEIKAFVSYVYEEIKKGNYEFMKYINTDFNIIMSLGEYFKSNAFKENLKLQKINNLPGELFAVVYKKPGGAYFEKSAKTFVYANHYEAPIDRGIDKVWLTLIVFHELRHAVQDQNKNNSFASILYQMEDKRSGLTYLITHDDWFMELDADIAGVKETLDFISDHPDLYDKKQITFLKKHYRERKYFLKNFNYDKLFLNYCTHKLKHPEHETSLEWEKLLFDEKGNIRRIDDILSNDNFSRVDEDFIRKFITSEVFANSYDINDLSEDALEYLNESCTILLKQEEDNYFDLSGKHYAHKGLSERNRLNRYKTQSLDRISRYENSIKEIEGVKKKKHNIKVREKALGYIGVLSMTIGVLILLCIFMIYIILQR